tara:strand:- start:25 stop:243 length:219 start_codon:yes stop_codon:yes gene_type:complete
MNQMRNKESTKERKKRFQRLSSQERKKLIRKKLKMQGLKEGSGLRAKDQSYYDKAEMIDLILLTSCLQKNKI